MALGHSVRGNCYTTAQGILDAIVAQYPQQQGTDVIYLKAAPIWTAPTLSYQTWSGSIGTSDSVTVSLPSCDTQNVPSDPLFSVVMFAACAVMFGLGFIGTR